MAFTKRGDVNRTLTYPEADANWTELETIHADVTQSRDIVTSGGILYPTTTDGLAATAEGGYFVVPDTVTDELVYYRKESGIAVEKVRIGYRLPFVGGTLTGALNHAPAVSLASAATVGIGAASANAISITGTTTITAFDTIASGAVRVLTFAGALTLTHNETSLILPGGANITTAAGDVAVMLSLGSGNWRCIGYMRANGKSVIAPTYVFRTAHTWAVAGEIKVPSGNLDVIPGFYFPLPATGQTAKLIAARHKLGAGTSATVKLQKNGTDITGFTGMSVTTTATTTDPADVTLAADDRIQPIVTAVSGAPYNLELTIIIEHTITA
ncbi:MAG: hypothetical protein ACOY42_01990 [Pseudomonadota bacterium]